MENIFNELLLKPTNYRRVPEFDANEDFEGIKAITYDGVSFDGKKTKVFAYLGYPQNINEKAPAVVLVHGGGGFPFLEWVKMWNERGYVALAMSTTGDFPTVVNAVGKNDGWHHGLYGVFSEQGYTSAPDNDLMKYSDKPIDEQWMYHAVSQVILANNILRSDENVNPDKIGIVGISWGGIITAIAIGYDNRFAFAVPIYGSGYLLESKGSAAENFISGKTPELWIAENNFKNISMPILWLCWNSDSCFSVNSNSKSYLDTVKNNDDTRLSMVHEMEHDHPCAWVRKEPFAFADFVCKNGKRLPAFKKKCEKFEILNPDNLDIWFVKLYYIDKPLSYSKDYRMEQEWKIVRIKYKDGVLDYEVPDEAKAYYLEITTYMYTDVYITCSQLVEK